jgi:hypothetical protein
MKPAFEISSDQTKRTSDGTKVPTVVSLLGLNDGDVLNKKLDDSLGLSDCKCVCQKNKKKRMHFWRDKSIYEIRATLTEHTSDGTRVPAFGPLLGL